MANANQYRDVFSYVRDHKYSHGNESWDDISLRVAKSIASCEERDSIDFWTDRFYTLIKSKIFVPGGRIIANSGRPRGNLFNCFIKRIDDSIGGSAGWAYTFKDAILIMSNGGGLGLDFSQVRPRGSKIHGVGGETNGSVALMDSISALGHCITGGQGRGIALLFGLPINHGDIKEFILAKKEHERMRYANISILIDDEKEFLEHLDDPKYLVDLKHNNQTVGKVKLKQIVNMAIDNMIAHGEPGFINRDAMNQDNNHWYFASIDCANPCLSGDTLVYVADGRGHVPIKQLAEEGRDLPVFCLDDNNKLDIRTMRRPRITGYKRPVYKVTLEDGFSVTATDNHKFLLKDGTYKEVKNLKCGDSLDVIVRYKASIKDIFPKDNSRSQDYWWANDGFRSTLSEHRKIVEFYNNTKIKKGQIVHHIDYNAQNNSPDNLVIMAKKDHDLLHSQDMVGDKNPMRRAKNEWSKEKWKEYHNNMSEAVKGINNGRCTGHTHDELRQEALNLTRYLGRQFTIKEWRKYAKENKLPQFFKGWRKKHLGGEASLAKWAAHQCDFDYIEAHPQVVRAYYDCLEQGYDVVIKSGKSFVRKHCEYCSAEFFIPTESREIAFCSRTCFNKKRHSDTKYCKKINKKPFDKEKWKQSISDAKRKYHPEIRERQSKIYSDLKFKLGRNPLKTEWQRQCRLENISVEIGRKSSPYKSYNDLKEAGDNYNHKVVSVEFVGYEDVYNGTVDEFHNFIIGGWEGKTENGKTKQYHIVNSQCGEVAHTGQRGGGICCLGSIDISRLVNSKGKIKRGELETTVFDAVRFLDNTYDCSTYPTSEIETLNKGLRRVGLGIMGLHHYLLKRGIKYTDLNESIAATEEIMRLICRKDYWASIELAKEKGSFEFLESDKFLQSGFCKRALTSALRDAVEEHGIRNATLISIAPTGTISRVAGCSPGLEPAIAAAAIIKYNFREEPGKKERTYDTCNYIDPVFLELLEKEEHHLFESAGDVSLDAHLAIQAAVQKYVDASVSKTVNFEEGTLRRKDVIKYLREYFPKLKGFTLMPIASEMRSGGTQIPVDEKTWRKWLEDKNYISKYNGENKSCRSGKCDI